MKYFLWFLFIGNVVAYAQQTIKDLTVKNLTATNTITGSISGNSATVTTNANLSGPITSSGNTTSIASQTGTGSTFVMNSSPTLITPILGSASSTSINGTVIPTSKTLVVTTDKLNALSATSSSELAGVISDESGSGALVFSNSPTLVAPILGSASGTSLSLSTPLPVSSGGTGLNTLTANNVILGNATSSPSFVAPGTSGNVLTSNGTTWVSSAASGGSGVISAVGATGSNGNIKLAFGTSNTNSDCTGSPCLVTQIGTEVTSMTRSGTGAYTLNFARTYATLICSFDGFNGGSNVQAFLGNNQIVCSSCNSIAFTIEKSGAATDAHGVIDCNTNY